MSDDLIHRLLHLVSLNEPWNGGPYQGYAAQECVLAMREAAEALTAARKDVLGKTTGAPDSAVVRAEAAAPSTIEASVSLPAGTQAPPVELTVHTIKVKYDPNNPAFGLVGEPHDHQRHPNERLGLNRAVQVINFDTGETCHKKQLNLPTEP